MTEQRNERTGSLDLLSVPDGVRLLHSVDREIFQGTAANCGLNAVVDQLSDLADRVASDLDHARIDRLCFSGSGTSGRLCYIAAYLAERRWPSGLICFNVNGGLSAYLKSRAGIEDDYHRGVGEVSRLSAAECRMALVAVSCGLSAPYIAGQLFAATHTLSGHVAALGFNPPAMARSEIRGENFRSFRDVLEFGASRGNFSVLAPIVGPEAIAGSVRLKAGTATMIVLGALAAFLSCRREGGTGKSYQFMAEFIGCAEHAIAHVHEQNHALAVRLVESITQQLRKGARTHIGSSDVLGLLIAADCAECPPTFGARYDDLIGYCSPNLFDGRQSGGFDAGRVDVVPRQYGYLTNMAAPVTDDDLVILFDGGPNTLRRRAGNLIMVNTSRPGVPVPQPGGNRLSLLSTSNFADLFHAIQFKAFLNSVSSLAFCQVGKVYSNVMIDLRISNAKLFDRSISIISSVCRCSEAVAKCALLSAIYETDQPGQFLDRAILDHVTASAQKEHLISIAILLVTQPHLDHAAATALAGRGQSIRQLTPEPSLADHDNAKSR